MDVFERRVPKTCWLMVSHAWPVDQDPGQLSALFSQAGPAQAHLDAVVQRPAKIRNGNLKIFLLTVCSASAVFFFFFKNKTKQTWLGSNETDDCSKGQPCPASQTSSWIDGTFRRLSVTLNCASLFCSVQFARSVICFECDTKWNPRVSVLFRRSMQFRERWRKNSMVENWTGPRFSVLENFL